MKNNETEFANQDEEISKGMDYKWMWEQLRKYVENKYSENYEWREECQTNLRRLISDPLVLAERVQAEADDLKVAQNQMATYGLIEDMFVNLEHDAEINAKAKRRRSND